MEQEKKTFEEFVLEEEKRKLEDEERLKKIESRRAVNDAAMAALAKKKKRRIPGGALIACGAILLLIAGGVFIARNKEHAVINVSRSAIEKEAERQLKENPNQLVWLPTYGEKYHCDPECSDMKKTDHITVREAQERGYEPCDKCFEIRE